MTKSQRTVRIEDRILPIKKPPDRVRVEAAFFVENPAIAFSKVSLVGCSGVALV